MALQQEKWSVTIKQDKWFQSAQQTCHKDSLLVTVETPVKPADEQKASVSLSRETTVNTCVCLYGCEGWWRRTPHTDQSRKGIWAPLCQKQKQSNRKKRFNKRESLSRLCWWADGCFLYLRKSFTAVFYSRGGSSKAKSWLSIPRLWGYPGDEDIRWQTETHLLNVTRWCRHRSSWQVRGSGGTHNPQREQRGLATVCGEARSENQLFVCCTQIIQIKGQDRM